MSAKWLGLVAVVVAGCGGGSGGAIDSPPPSAPRTAPHSTVAARLHVGGSPCGLVGAAGAVWVSDAATAQLLRVDPVSGHVARVARLDRTPCAITADGLTLWIITQSGRLDRVDAATGNVVARIPVGAMSYQAIVAAGKMWVSNRSSGTISVVDPGADQVVRTVRTPGALPGGMVYAAGSVWVGDDSDDATDVLRFDPETFRATKVRAGMRPAYLTATPGAVWVSDVDGGTVTRVDTVTEKATAVVPAGTSPVNLAATSGSRPEVWVPDDTGGHLTRIDATDARVVETIDAAGKGPAIVAPIGNDIWATMFTAGEVWRIRPAAR